MNLDASNMPNIKVPHDPPRGSNLRNLVFDRILCDVPCSGDGTLRKNVAIWKRWSPLDGNGLHSYAKNNDLHLRTKDRYFSPQTPTTDFEKGYENSRQGRKDSLFDVFPKSGRKRGCHCSSPQRHSRYNAMVMYPRSLVDSSRKVSLSSTYRLSIPNLFGGRGYHTGNHQLIRN